MPRESKPEKLTFQPVPKSEYQTHNQILSNKRMKAFKTYAAYGLKPKELSGLFPEMPMYRIYELRRKALK